MTCEQFPTVLAFVRGFFDEPSLSLELLILSRQHYVEFSLLALIDTWSLTPTPHTVIYSSLGIRLIFLLYSCPESNQIKVCCHDPRHTQYAQTQNTDEIDMGGRLHAERLQVAISKHTNSTTILKL